MSWQSLLSHNIFDFIRTHEKDDVKSLALKKPPDPDWDYKLILDQIKSRQKAALKIPLWVEHQSDIILPSSDLLEQASSSATAMYKASIIKADNFVDLTGGCGVDSWALSKYASHGYCIEKDKTVAELLAHNLPLVSSSLIETLNTHAEDFIKTMGKTQLALIDPQRRDAYQKGKFRLEECRPNILALLPGLLKKAEIVMIKTSPMLDITEGIRNLEDSGAYVQAVHCVEWNGECKELLFLASKNSQPPATITAIRLNHEGKVLHRLSFLQKEEETLKPSYSDPLNYIYEPSPAFQKSGGFSTIAQEYNLQKLAPQTHLYTSEFLEENFPGRFFKIIGQYQAKADKIPLKQAHITVRNFPMKAPELRKKLKLKDGGQDYLFACTLKNSEKILLHARKTASSEHL